ncbi:MAG: MBOAT family protein [Bacteroidetes bacterium]|nr:MBOAT family protein [Bacteroidota bacterium]
MVFSSLIFLYFFLPLNLILYYVSGNLVYRNILLTLFSFFFYAWGEPVWIVLLLFSALFDYGNGILIEKLNNKSKAKLVVAFSVIVNIGLLVAFKYSGFLYDNLSLLINLPFARPEVTLPIGISFYTFQTISYTIDVYRGDVKAQRNPMNFLLFVSLYHQLVAGPIVRYKTIADEINGRKFQWNDFSSGIGRFSLGLFKKIVIADAAGSLVDNYLITNFDLLTSPTAWFGLSMFAIQIYFDFSGYSDMAIGLGRMFGFHYNENFKNPYAANSITDFWRRWHISLSTFFRDYVYIPLGGNKVGKRRMYYNIFIVWALTGFWHGASWNFMLWGLYFAMILLIEKRVLLSIYSKIPIIFRYTITLVFIVFGWSLFYFEDLSKWSTFCSNLFNFSSNQILAFSFDLRQNIYWFTLVILLCIPWDELPYFTKRWEVLAGNQIILTSKIVLHILILIICTSLLVGSSYHPFLYFRF